MSSADAARDLGDQRAALHRYVTRLVAPDLHQAEDIVQETLLRAWQHADQLDWAERPIRQWLFRIARNLVVDAWRKDRSVPIGIAADLFPERADRSDLAETAPTGTSCSKACGSCRRSTARSWSTSTCSGAAATTPPTPSASPAAP